MMDCHDLVVRLVLQLFHTEDLFENQTVMHHSRSQSCNPNQLHCSIILSSRTHGCGVFISLRGISEYSITVPDKQSNEPCTV